MLKSGLKLLAAAAVALTTTVSVAHADVVAKYTIRNNTGNQLVLESSQCSGGGTIWPPFFIQAGQEQTFEGTSPASSTYCNVRYKYTAPDWTEYGCQFQVMTFGYASANAYKGKDMRPNCDVRDQRAIQNGYFGEFIMN